MTRRKKLKELVLKDDFMFGTVMSMPENCKRLLEMTMRISIGRIEVIREKSITYHPEYRGVRLDVYARDERNTRYNIEMQMMRRPAMNKRARYYHSQIDVELLLSGLGYAALPDVYVIFICDFDPFGKGRYLYTFSRSCREVPSLELKDGGCCLFLNAYGKNDGEVPEELRKFLQFIKADLEESEKDFEDSYVKQLQDSILKICCLLYTSRCV